MYNLILSRVSDPMSICTDCPDSEGLSNEASDISSIISLYLSLSLNFASL